MSFHNMGGDTQGAFVTYDVYAQKQTMSWRWLAVAVLLTLGLVISLAAAKTLASVEQAAIELPKQMTSSTATGPKPQAPVVAAAVDRSPELQAELEQWVATQTGSEWAFYVRSLESDELAVSIDAAKPFDLASVYKLFLLKALSQKIPAEAWASTNVTERSYLACVQAMISVSDNPCAEAIAAKLGWSALHRQNHADGYKSTVFNRADYLAGSAADTGLLLDRLFHGDGYDAKTKEIAMASLSKAKRSEAIRKACSDCIVYNKTGELNGIRHDAAIVEKDGKAYVLVIFTKNASWSQLTRAAELINTYL